VDFGRREGGPDWQEVRLKQNRETQFCFSSPTFEIELQAASEGKFQDFSTGEAVI